MLLLAVQRRISTAGTRPARLLTRLGAAVPAALPVTTSAVVLLVGAGMAVRAAAGFA